MDDMIRKKCNRETIDWIELLPADQVDSRLIEWELFIVTNSSLLK